MSNAARRAPVVDDSRSARVILSRLLEIYGMQVDTAESGEQALEYVTSHRPDVIFMDHLMPGMDGFEAVRALKANARTQSIPVMMYSSQDGPDYLREALTSGAVGVLPKTLTQTDVSRALYQLHLLPDRREAQAPPRIPSHIDEPRRAEAKPTLPSHTSSAAQPEVRAAVSSMLKTYDADLRHALHSEFEAMTQRLLESQRAAMRAEAAPKPPTESASESGPVPHHAVSPAAAAPWIDATTHSTHAASRTSTARAWWVAAIMLVALGGVSGYAYRQYTLQLKLQQNNTQMNALLQEQQRQIEALRSELLQRSATPAIDTIPVPYGEAPLAGARVLTVRDRILALQAAGFKGVVQIDTYIGDFCLTGSAVTGYMLARAEVPIRRCDAIGNPFEDGLSDGAQQSQEFTDMLAMVARNGTLPTQVKLSANGRMPAQRYPEQTAANADTLTAGEWNKIAAINHRVEITLVQSTTL